MISDGSGTQIRRKQIAHKQAPECMQATRSDLELSALSPWYVPALAPDSPDRFHLAADKCVDPDAIVGAEAIAPF